MNKKQIELRLAVEAGGVKKTKDNLDSIRTCVNSRLKTGEGVRDQLSGSAKKSTSDLELLARAKKLVKDLERLKKDISYIRASAVSLCHFANRIKRDYSEGLDDFFDDLDDTSDEE